VLEANAATIILAAVNNLKSTDWQVRQSALNAMIALIQHGQFSLSLIEVYIHSVLLDSIRVQIVVVNIVEGASALLQDENENVHETAIRFLEELAKYRKSFQ
jgi:hypothetical protein